MYVFILQSQKVQNNCHQRSKNKHHSNRFIVPSVKFTLIYCYPSLNMNPVSEKTISWSGIVSSQYNLTAQMEPVQDKLSFTFNRSS